MHNSDMRVPLLDLKRQYTPLKTQILAAIEQVADSQHLVLGPQVEQIEASIASYTAAGHAIGVSSGTDAQLVLLMALGVGPGDVVAWLGAVAPSLAQIQFGASLRCAAYALRFDRGIGTLRQGVIDMGSVALRSAGAIDLGAETIAIRSQLGPLGFRTTGSLADPQHRLDAMGTVGGVAEGATGIARGVLGALGRDGAPERTGCDAAVGTGGQGAAPPRQPVPSQPALPGVLRDLLGR